nr:hypothetical protein [Micromonospora sp. DSM 115978]
MDIPAARMNRDEVDYALVALVATYDRISAAMYAVDTHPGLALLRGGGLTGETARLAERSLGLVGPLWSNFTALGRWLDRARTVRDRRSRPGDDELAELTRLLRTPVVPLGPEGAALDEAAPGPVVERVALPELARRIEAGSAEVAVLLADVDTARARMVDGFGTVTGALEGLRDRGSELGVDVLPPDRIDRIEARLAEARRGAEADPVAAAGAGPAGTALRRTLADLAEQVGALDNRLAELTEVRDSYPDRARRLRAALLDVAAAEERTGRAYAVAQRKIADPGLPTLPDAAPALHAHLTQLDQFRREGRWARLADELAVLEQATGSAREHAVGLGEAADGLMRRRAELRGRLAAYRAKAARLGLIEHTELSALHRRAHDLLYTSPCDLPASTRAVVAYQRCLNELTERS